MDIRKIEKAAEIVFAMCKRHPEICPHEYRLIETVYEKKGNEERREMCDICGSQRTLKIKPNGEVTII